MTYAGVLRPSRRIRRQAGRALLLVGLLASTAAPVSAQAPGEVVEYYGTDAIGSIRIVWDAAGTVVGRQDYAPFGRPLVPVPALPKEGFGGQEKDDETDQAYFHARMFEARAGGSHGPIRSSPACSSPNAGIGTPMP